MTKNKPPLNGGLFFTRVGELLIVVGIISSGCTT